MPDTRTVLGWAGTIRVRKWGADGLLVVDRTFPNLVVDTGLDAVINALNGSVALADSSIAWVALGSDPTPAANGDTTLGSEQFRKAVTSQTKGGTGTLTTTLFVTPDEANFQIEEVGWFAADGTSAADSGTLIARVLFSEDKTSGESLQISRTDSLTATTAGA